MENKIQVFKNTEFGEIRTTQINGEPWFVGKDVVAALGYANPSKALKDHVDEEDKLNNESLSSLGQRGGWFINESGLYSLILSSKLPTAKKFKRWVTAEVLPTIRKHGGYVTDELLDKLNKSEAAVEFFLTALANERSRRESIEGLFGELNSLYGRLDELFNEILPQAIYCENVLQCEDAIPVTVIASSYGLSAVEFNRMLHAFGIQRKVGGTWVLYSRYNDNGYMVMKTYLVGENESVRHSYWTERGRKFLYDELKQRGILPEVERVLPT